MRPRGTWRKPSKLDHYCSFPTALVARIIELTTNLGDLVMDPFAGSGVVLAQAAAMGRHYVGFEINEEYIRMFQETVKDEVADEWEEIKAWRKSQVDAQVDFEQTIMKLRALKYTRQVTKPFLEALKPERQFMVRAVLCVALIPNEYQYGHPFDVKVLIVVDQRLSEFEAALKIAEARARRPPLTQYGIRSDIQIATYPDLKQWPDLLNQTLYLYPKYKPRSYSVSDLLQNWLENGRLETLAEGAKVPMLANVAVDVAWVLDQ